MAMVKGSSRARLNILLAAQKLFSERGYEGASTTDIANEAGVTQPLIHYHFQSKQKLFKEVIREGLVIVGKVKENFFLPVGRIHTDVLTIILRESVSKGEIWGWIEEFFDGGVPNIFLEKMYGRLIHGWKNPFFLQNEYEKRNGNPFQPDEGGWIHFDISTFTSL